VASIVRDGIGRVEYAYRPVTGLLEKKRFLSLNQSG
jgi:hypothetical protein